MDFFYSAFHGVTAPHCTTEMSSGETTAVSAGCNDLDCHWELNNVTMAENLRTLHNIRISWSVVAPDRNHHWKSDSSDQQIHLMGWKIKHLYVIILSEFKEKTDTFQKYFSALNLILITVSILTWSQTDLAFTTINWGKPTDLKLILKTPLLSQTESKVRSQSPGLTSVAHCNLFSGKSVLRSKQTFSQTQAKHMWWSTKQMISVKNKKTKQVF